MSFTHARKLLVVIAVGMGFVLSGCTSGVPSQPNHSGSGFSDSPAGDVIYKCLIDKGWEVTISWDGGVTASSDTVPAAQKDKFDTDLAECTAIVDNRILSMLPAEIEKVYEEELNTRDCLIGRGYEVDVPPSKQEYVDSFQGERWSAYGAANFSLPDLSDDEWRELNEACPQPAWSLGGS